MYTLLVVDDNDYHRMWLKLDLMKPGMNGLDVLQQLHDDDPHLPIIIHTVYPAPEHHPAMHLAAAYFVKSSDTGMLKRTIAAVLYGRNRSRIPSRSSVHTL